MGQVCSEDQYDGEGNQKTIIPKVDVFIVGEQLPTVVQNRSTFDDDDFIIINNPRDSTSYQRQSIGQPYSIQPYNLTENVHIKVQAQAILNPQDLKLLVSVITNEKQIVDPNGRERHGIDLVCLIDHGDSMIGGKLNLVQLALSNMLNFLAPQDRLCLIMFDSKSERMTRLMKCTSDNLTKFKIAIAALKEGSGTDVANGMNVALSVLKHRRYKNPISAIFLLSVGKDEGAEQKISTYLNQYDIKNPFTIITFGIGKDVCPKIMSEIAYLKSGQFYFLPNSDMIDICLMEALGGLTSVIAKNVRLTVRPNNQIKKSYGDKWKYHQWKNYSRLYQPHLFSGVHKDFVFDIQLSSIDPTQIIIELELDPIEQGQTILITEKVEISQFTENSQQNHEVFANFYRVKAAEAFNSALILAQEGNYKQGQQVLQGIQQFIQDQDISDPQLAIVTADLQMAQQYCHPPQFESEGKHYMTQLHIVHMYQKPRGVPINAYQNGQEVQLDCCYSNNIQSQYKQIIAQQNREVKSQNQTQLVRQQQQ